MKSVRDLQPDLIKYVFTDIDGTLTRDGQLPSESYEALWRLKQSGSMIIPITGRPAGWCDLIARLWPGDAVVGENGALAYRMNEGRMQRQSFVIPDIRLPRRKRLKTIAKELFTNFPKAKIAADQFSRQVDLAIDFAEDVQPPLPLEDAKAIAKIFVNHGATAKISDIHVNGWFGQHDKLSACRWISREWLNLDLEKRNLECVFVGDSQNDEPMFKFFKNSVAVANIQEFLSSLKFKPAFLTDGPEAEGFAELSQHLLRD